MSHSTGQITEDNQNLPAGQESSPIEDQTDSDVSLLSDADYEFLFNQLLEGVAHGWHDRKIIKFFDRLGDRGKQENWVAWLERLRSKIITLPIQSKRQLGTIMIRLGEITQSASEVNKIGAASLRIGRELLFGNTEDVVWEYVGPDLIVDTPVSDLETEEKQEFSERLPEDFAELGANVIEDPLDTPQSSDNSPSQESIVEDLFPKDLDSLDLDSSDELPQEVLSDSSTTEKSIELDLPTDILQDLSSESTTPVKSPLSITDDLDLDFAKDNEASLSDETAQQTEELTTGDPFDDEFEFELDTSETEPVTECLAQDVSEQKEPLRITDSIPNSPPKENLVTDSSPSQELPKIDSTSEHIPLNIVEPENVEPEAQKTNLNQDYQESAQEILKKDSISEEHKDIPLEKQLNDVALSSAEDLDQSSIELIEGWFNLGLKQVSGGEFDKAIASWEKALNINPYLSEAWHNRGSALGRLGKYQAAVESFQKALEIDPNNYQAWNDRAHALYQLQKWSAAADSWSNAIKITPANHLFWYNRGCALEQLESWAESISSYEKSLEIKPDFQPARSRYTNLIADNSRSN